MRASSTFNFELGRSTRECFAREALRILVSKSAIGSVVILPRPYSLSKKLPARLGHAGNLALQREPAETNAAHLKLAQESARTSANPAAVAPADFELRLLQLLRELRGASHTRSFSLKPTSGPGTARRAAS